MKIVISFIIVLFAQSSFATMGEVIFTLKEAYTMEKLYVKKGISTKSNIIIGKDVNVINLDKVVDKDRITRKIILEYSNGCEVAATVVKFHKTKSHPMYRNISLTKSCGSVDFPVYTKATIY